jgi:general secretion pathway protein E
VRKLCPQCKIADGVTPENEKKVRDALARLPKDTKFEIPEKLAFYKAVGCPACGGLGYKGRVGIYEAISMTPEMQKLIQTSTVIENEIENLALSQGSMLMIHDGIFKALKGETTIEEVFRVA